MKKIVYLIIILLIVIFGFNYFKNKTKTVDSFESCVAAGNPIMEIYPRQCRDGENFFVEEITVLEYNDLIKVTSPIPGAEISSPLTITGEARGMWFFEASFPIRVYDADGNELGVAVAQAQGEWMTEEYVPFQATLNFNKGDAVAGYLVFEKDNASGLPEFDDSVAMLVLFSQ